MEGESGKLEGTIMNVYWNKNTKIKIFVKFLCNELLIPIYVKDLNFHYLEFEE